MRIIKASLLGMFSLCFALAGHMAFAQDNSIPEYTYIQGTAFQDSFTAGYAFARIYGTGRNKRAAVTIGDGIMGDCGVVLDGAGAQIKFSEPTANGTYKHSSATYYELGSLARTFSTAQITVSRVTDSMVYGSVHLVSVNGVLDGPFAAQICQ